MRRASTTLAITSGKGGVGKSVVTVNLAETLVADGHRVALIDADLGQGACAILLNETPPASVIDLVRLRARTPQVKHTTLAGITLVQAVGEVGEADGRERALFGSLDELLDDLRQTHTYILIDTPAGADGAVRWALDRADLGVLVLAGEPTAIADAYRLAKLVWQADPTFPFASIVNFAEDAADGLHVSERFAAITDRFLGCAPSYLGQVPFSAQIRKSVLGQRPAVREPGRVQEAFRALTDLLCEGRHAAATPVNL